MPGLWMMNANGLPPKPEGSPPDSTEPYGICPRCQRHANFTVVGQAPLTFTSQYIQERSGEQKRDHDQRLSILACQGCEDHLVVIEDKYVGGVASREGRGGGTVQWRGFHWWPTPGSAPHDPSLPVSVADALAEAGRCLAVHAPRAAVVMFRAALALIVQDKGSQAAQGKNNLAAQLKQMSADGDLDRTLADWADHIRVVGNSGAHPDPLDPITQDEAEDLSRLVSSLVEFVYVMPARVQRARSKP